MLANNLQQKLNKGNKLLVDDLFYSIQTEGPFTGKPAYFIRLFGCNLNCSFCDTEQVTQPSKFTISQIVKRVDEECASHLVVITGGEPMLQNVAPLVTALTKDGFSVQFETNGTLSVPDLDYTNPNLFIVVSPKTKKINKRIAENALAFKYIIQVGKQRSTDGLPKAVYRPDNASRIIVSPMFELDDPKATAENTTETVNISKQFGYHMSLQWHKFIGIE